MFFFQFLNVPEQNKFLVNINFVMDLNNLEEKWSCSLNEILNDF